MLCSKIKIGIRVISLFTIIVYQNNRRKRPGSFYTSTTNGGKVQLLRKSVQSKGAGKLLKVMAGDKLDVKVDYYIATTATNNNTANGLNTIINALGSIIDNSPITTTLHGSGSSITTSLNGSTPFTGFMSPQNGTAGTSLPKAYLNIIFFDNQFKYISGESVQVSAEGSGQTIYRIGGSAKTAPKNGFAYIYVSNESDNLVYFDNLQVTHEHGPLLQESHYYPYGLGMAGISSSAITNAATNAYKANGGTELGSGEWADGKGLELYETAFRSYDAQIGRFMQVDPLMESSANFGGYTFVNDNPAMSIDPTGLKLQKNEPGPPDHGTGDNPGGLDDDGGGGGGGGGGGYFSYKDSNGNMWHHSDVLAGTASQGQQYISGNGVDGFGDATYGGSGGGIMSAEIANPQKYFAKIQSVIAHGYQISNSDFFSLNGKNYASLGFYSDKDVKENTFTWYMKVERYYVYQNNENSFGLDGQANNLGEGNGWGMAHTVVDVTDNTVRIVIQKGFEAANKTTPSTLLEEGSKVVKTGGRILGAVGIGLTIGDALTDPNGWQTKHTIDAAVGVACFIPVVGEFVAVGWFVGNIVSLGINGKSLSQNIQDY